MKTAEKQRRLGWKIDIAGLDGLRLGNNPTVTVTAQDANAQHLQGASVKLAIVRPGLVEPEQIVDLVETSPGVYRAQLTLALPGAWVAAIQLQRGDDRFELREHIEVAAAQ